MFYQQYFQLKFTLVACWDNIEFACDSSAGGRRGPRVPRFGLTRALGVRGHNHNGRRDLGALASARELSRRVYHPMLKIRDTRWIRISRIRYVLARLGGMGYGPIRHTDLQARSFRVTFNPITAMGTAAQPWDSLSLTRLSGWIIRRPSSMLWFGSMIFLYHPSHRRYGRRSATTRVGRIAHFRRKQILCGHPRILLCN